MTNQSQTKLNALYGATLAAIFSLTASAQDGMLEEVIVTAQKRAEDLQDTAIAIRRTSVPARPPSSQRLRRGPPQS